MHKVHVFYCVVITSLVVEGTDWTVDKVLELQAFMKMNKQFM